MAQPQATVLQEINGLYVALYGRAADGPGITYWINSLTTYDPAVTLTNAATMAISPADAKWLGLQFVNTQNTYVTTQYGSLNDTQFIQALYVNIGGNTGEVNGVLYWINQLTTAEAVPGATQTSARAGIVGQFARDMLSIDLTVGAAALGLSAADYAAAVARQQQFQNKVSVSEYYAIESTLPNGGILIAASTSSPAFAAAQAAVAAVTSNAASVTAAEAAIALAVSTSSLTPILPPVPPVLVPNLTLTKGIDAITSTSAGDVVIGTLAPAGASTLNPGDSLSMAGGTLMVVDTLGGGANELAGVLISGPFMFQVQEVAAAGTYDFAALSTVTKVISSNSAFSTTFTTLPTGAVVESSGAATATAGAANITFTMASKTAAVSVQFDGGVNGVTIQNTTAGDAATTATISSTGAANGTAIAYDAVKLTNSSTTMTSLTINAATNLTASLWNADWKNFGFANTDTLTLSGAAASVNVNFGGTIIDANTVNASGLTAGGLTATFGADVKSFTGGAGSDVIFLSVARGATVLQNYNEGAGNNFLLETAAIGPLPFGMVANGGSATGTNVISAQLLSIGDAANITNFTLMDLGYAAAATYNASQYTGDAFTGVTYTGGTGGGTTAATATGNVVVTNLVGTVETLSVTGTTGSSFTGPTGSFNETHQIKISQANAATATAQTGDTLAINFANTDAAGNLTQFSDAAAYPIVTSHIVTATINAGTTVTGGGAGEVTDVVNTLADMANLLKTVTITGSANFLGFGLGLGGDGVVTDVSATASVFGTLVASSLTLINGSAATGNLTLADGFTSQSPTNGPNLSVTYTGLTIKGGTGIDLIVNGAASGVIVLGNGGTSLAVATTGYVGNNNETITFGTGFDAAVIHNSTYLATGPAATAFEKETINGTLTSNHDIVDLSWFTTGAATDYSTNAIVTGATNLANAENAVATAIGALGGIGYFTSGNIEYIVAKTAHAGNLTNGDAVVTLMGGAFHNIADAGGVLTLVT